MKAQAELPEDLVLAVSGRVGYEIVHKAVIARIPIVVAVSVTVRTAICVFDTVEVFLLHGASINAVVNPVTVRVLVFGATI